MGMPFRNVNVVETNYSSLLECLAEIANSTKLSEIRAKANGLLRQIKNYNFILVLYIIKLILMEISIVSSKLQKPDVNLLEAISLIHVLKKSFYKLRTDDTQYESLYERVLKVCDSLNIKIPTVKNRKVSCKVNNYGNQHLNSNKKDEIKHFVYYTVLDGLINSLEVKFSQETLYIIGSVGRMNEFKQTTSDIDLLSKELNLNGNKLNAKLRLIKNLGHFEKGTTKTIHIWLQKLSRSDSFPNVFRALSSFVTIPVTSCTCEQSFSKLNIVKKKLRITMKQDRLDSMLMIFVEQNLATSVNYDDVIEEFKS